MVRAEEVARVRGASAAATAAVAPAPADRDLLARRDRVAERLTTLQLELGGLFSEMAIRDHVEMDVLIERAAALQQVDAELAHLDGLLGSGAGAAAGKCPSCRAPHARGAGFCWQCGTALAAEGG
jgi:hypothetical protein